MWAVLIGVILNRYVRQMWDKKHRKMLFEKKKKAGIPLKARDTRIWNSEKYNVSTKLTYLVQVVWGTQHGPGQSALRARLDQSSVSHQET